MRLADRARTCDAFRMIVLAPLACSLLLACSLPALAQGGGRPGGPGGRGPRAEDLRETLTILMMVRMKEELGLSKEQYEQILPRVEEMEKARQAGFESRRELGVRLRALLKQGSAEDSEFREIVEKISELDEAEHRREQAFDSGLRALLSPRQQGQLILFRQRFRGWLEERMREMRELRPRRQGRPGPGGRSAFEDDAPGLEEDGPPQGAAPPR